MADVDITSLSVEISAESQGAELNIDKLATAISNLRTKGNVTKVVNSLDKLAGSIATLKQASAGMSGLDKITSFLNGLSDVNTTASAKSINTVVNAIKKIPAAVSGLNGVDFYSMSGSITQLTNALAPLSILDASNLKALGSAFNAIGKVPDLTDKLKATDLDSFASSCQKISAAITPLASQLDKVGNAFAKLPPQLSKVVTQANRVTAANEKQRKSYLSLSNQMNGFMQNMAKLVSLKAIAEYLGNAVAKFNDFYEAANMFGVSMGDMTNEASGFIDKMEQLLGIDPSEAMNAMANIYSMTKSFGLAKEQAYTLSKSLTQLGYDLSSLKNIPISEAFTKIRSAMAGELEPMLQLGVDISQARLQQELLALGFNKQVSTLSQADKATLRYIAILKQTTYAQGDFARTLSSPANTIRVLKAQLSGLARDIGSLLYPALKSILPPLIAAVELIREFVQWVAKLMGVKVVLTDFAKSADSVGGIGDAMDNTTDSTKKAAKALKDYTMGFDELNIIDPTQGSSDSGAGAGAAGNLLGDVDLSGYDMFKDYVGNAVDEIKEKLRKLAPIVAAIGAGFAAWAIGNALLTALKDTHDWAYKLGKIVGGLNPELLLVAGTVALIVGRFVQLYQNSENFRQGLARIKDLIYLAGLGFTQDWNISLTDGKLGESIKWLKEALSNLGQAIWNLIPEEWQGKISTAFETIQKVVKDLDLDLGDLVMTLIGIGLTISGHPVAGLAVLGFEAVSVAVRGLGSESEAEAFQLKSDWHDAFVNFGTIAAETVADIITALGNLINDFAILIGWIQNGVSETEMLDIQMNGNFLEGAIASLAQVIHNMGVFIGWIIKGVDESDRLAIAANGNFAEKFVLLIADVINGIKDAVTWFGKLIDKVSKFNPLSVGKNIIDGIAKGITGNTNVSNDAAKQLTNGIKETAQDELDIHSPSKLFEQFGIYIDQGLANGITAAQGYVDEAMQGLINGVTNAGSQFIEQGKQTGIGFVNNLDQTLTSTWQQLDTNLQNDFFGTIQNLWEAAQSGDVKTIGTTIAAVLWHAMGEEQRTQIKAIATNMITDLSAQLTNALSTLSAQAYQIGGELLNGITSKFGEIVSASKRLGNSLKQTFTAIQGPMSSTAKTISGLLSKGLASAFPSIYASMGTLIGTIGASFVAMLNAIGAALSATIFGIPAGLIALGAAAVLAASIAGITGSLGGKKSSSGGSYGDTGYSESDLSQIDYSNVPGTSQYNDANSGIQSSYASSAVQQLSAEEIRDAVYNGAYNALLDYKQRYDQGDKDNIFKVYLDGKQLTATVEKRKNERGRSIMGTEAYSY